MEHAHDFHSSAATFNVHQTIGTITTERSILSWRPAYYLRATQVAPAAVFVPPAFQSCTTDIAELNHPYSSFVTSIWSVGVTNSYLLWLPYAKSARLDFALPCIPIFIDSGVPQLSSAFLSGLSGFVDPALFSSVTKLEPHEGLFLFLHHLWVRFFGGLSVPLAPAVVKWTSSSFGSCHPIRNISNLR